MWDNYDQLVIYSKIQHAENVLVRSIYRSGNIPSELIYDAELIVGIIDDRSDILKFRHGPTTGSPDGSNN